MRGRVRAKRRRREDELEEEQAQLQEAEPEQQASAAPATLADKTLDLQKTAGNRAVRAALQRWPVDAADATPVADWPKHPEAVFDDKLVIPIESYQESHRGQPRPPAKREGEEGELVFGEIVIFTKTGKHSAELHKALLQGKQFAKVEIVIPGAGGGVRIILTNVLIIGANLGGDGESWTLSFEKREFSKDPRPHW